MTGLNTSDLEQVYDRLALAIDRATPARSELFLVKLTLLLAQQLADRDRFSELAELALRDL